MNHRRMGSSGLQLSEVALGSWLTAGNAVEEQAAIACIRRAAELGVNYFDCADAYAARRAEQITALALEPLRREDYALASKCYFPQSPAILDRGLSRQHIFTSVHKTLRNFRTDYVDLYYCHRYDEDTPLDETVRAFEDLVRAGKVLYWGVSEWSAEQIGQACTAAGRFGGYAPAVNQPRYNLLYRDIEHNGVLDACARLGLGVVVFSPLAQGLLTGKYIGGRAPRDSRLADARQNRFIQAIATDENHRRVDKLAEIARRAGISLTALSLAWCLRRPELTSVIIGASRPEQVEQNVAAAQTKLSADVLRELEALS